jgi:hypothetical protein
MPATLRWRTSSASVRENNSETAAHSTVSASPHGVVRDPSGPSHVIYTQPPGSPADTGGVTAMRSRALLSSGRSVHERRGGSVMTSRTVVRDPGLRGHPTHSAAEARYHAADARAVPVNPMGSYCESASIELRPGHANVAARVRRFSCGGDGSRVLFSNPAPFRLGGLPMFHGRTRAGAPTGIAPRVGVRAHESRLRRGAPEARPSYGSGADNSDTSRVCARRTHSVLLPMMGRKRSSPWPVDMGVEVVAYLRRIFARAPLGPLAPITVPRPETQTFCRRDAGCPACIRV